MNDNPTYDGRMALASKEFGTPLHFAVERRQEATVKYLLSIDADPGLKDAEGRTVMERSRNKDGKVWEELEKIIGDGNQK